MVAVIIAMATDIATVGLIMATPMVMVVLIIITTGAILTTAIITTIGAIRLIIIIIETMDPTKRITHMEEIPEEIILKERVQIIQVVVAVEF